MVHDPRWLEAMKKELESIKSFDVYDEMLHHEVPEEFRKEIKLYGVKTYEDGSAELYYKANDLFWGHEIHTSIDNRQNYESSTIVG